MMDLPLDPPPTYPALIMQVREPGKRLPWKQPLSTNPYLLANPFTGKPDEVEHNGKLYRTLVDVNVWEPGVQGSETLWGEIDANGNVIVAPPPPAEDWPAWIQPTGAHDAYNIGDKVTFEGKRYTSTINGNVWSPVAYPQGWEAG